MATSRCGRRLRPPWQTSNGSSPRRHLTRRPSKETAMNAWYLFTLLTAFGGWASISVDDMPDYAVARQPLTLTFVVRQHGFTPLNGLEPRVEAEARRQETIAATAARSGDA